jgi:hypothetical protein
MGQGSSEHTLMRAYIASHLAFLIAALRQVSVKASNNLFKMVCMGASRHKL